VDLLPDRTKETLATWLKEHPGARVVARDRAPSYAGAVSEGAPNAKQVADRWHLLDNAGDALERVLIRRYGSLKKTAALLSGAKVENRTEEKGSGSAPSKAERDRLARRERRLNRFQEVMERIQKGMGQRAVARELGLSRATVAKYARSGEFPERAARMSRSGLDPYREYIARRWADGCRNASAIWREIKEKGYPGGKVSVIQYCRLSFGGRKSAEAGPPPVKPPSARSAMWQLIRPLKKLDADEAAFRKTLIENDSVIASATQLVLRFQRMVKQRRRKDLAQWLDDAGKSGIPELAGFAKGLEADRVAVENGLSCKWSNGQTEGQVNRLKMIKRQMYGRANFDLLRLRVIHAD
jgi:transposase